MIEKLISGGQTGVDRAALDFALQLGIACGGWCPKGRRAEDGVIPPSYPLQETPTEEYPERTEWNVRDADGTLILTRGTPDRGTALTVKLAKRMKKPFYVVDLSQPAFPEAVRAWLQENAIRVLNVAGPRESSQKGIAHKARRFLDMLWQMG
jgi:putative molybdenum carrier protein